MFIPFITSTRIKTASTYANLTIQYIFHNVVCLFHCLCRQLDSFQFRHNFFNLMNYSVNSIYNENKKNLKFILYVMNRILK